MKKSLEERFWEKVNKDGPIIREELGPCWIWTGYCQDSGHGRFRWDTTIRFTAHRASWILTFGFISSDILVLHKCDNPPCVRPDHLWTGTCQDNMRDRDQKGRTASGEKNCMLKYPGLLAGENNGRAKLTRSDVENIRLRYKLGEKQVSLAKEFSVYQGTISAIILRRLWK